MNQQYQDEDEENFKLDECCNEMASDTLTMINKQMSAYFLVDRILLQNFNETGKLDSKRNSQHIANSGCILSLYLQYKKLELANLGKAITFRVFSVFSPFSCTRSLWASICRLTDLAAEEIFKAAF